MPDPFKKFMQINYQKCIASVLAFIIISHPFITFGESSPAATPLSEESEINAAVAQLMDPETSEMDFGCSTETNSPIFSVGTNDKPLPVSALPKLVAAARQKEGTKIYKSGSYTAKSSWSYIAVIENGGEKPLNDFTLNVKEVLEGLCDEPMNESFLLDNIPPWHRFELDRDTAVIVTFLGPLFSIFEMESSFTIGAAHPQHHANFVTYDFRTKQPANIQDFIDQQSLAQALQKNEVLQQIILHPDDGELDIDKSERESSFKQFKKAKDLSEVDSLLQGLELGCGVRWELDQFAIRAYNPKKNQLSVALGLPYSCEAMRGNFTLLELQVKPSSMFKKILAGLFNADGTVKEGSVLLPDISNLLLDN